MNQQFCDEEVDLGVYIKVIYKYRIMIMVFILVSMVFAGISSFRQPDRYEASATFFPLYETSNIRQEGIMVRPGPDIKDLIISILKSRKMADRIIEQLDLKKEWRNNLMGETRQALSDASEIALGKNGIIQLNVRSRSPELSAKIANAYVDNLDYLNSELDIGSQKQIVQVIDRAVVPETRMPRRTTAKVLLAGMASCMFSILLASFVEFIRSSNLRKIISEK